MSSCGSTSVLVHSRVALNPMRTGSTWLKMQLAYDLAAAMKQDQEEARIYQRAGVRFNLLAGSVVGLIATRPFTTAIWRVKAPAD